MFWLDQFFTFDSVETLYTDDQFFVTGEHAEGPYKLTVSNICILQIASDLINSIKINKFLPNLVGVLSIFLF